MDCETNPEASPLQDKACKNRWNNNRPFIDPGEGTDEVDTDQEPDWDNGSSSTLIPENVQERKQLWNGENRKAARDARKAAKNQTRFSVITTEEMDSVQEALHPEAREAAERAGQVPNGQGLADNETIDQNIVFNSHTFKYGSLRQGIHEKKIAKANAPRIPDPKTPEEERALLEPMLANLGIRTRVFRPTKERKNLFARLQTTIVGDLEAFENEQAETMIRMAGYWRYVNRRTYNQMVRNNELWDWATGQKLPEVEEESDLDAIHEEDESESDNLDGSTPVTTPVTTPSPETCYDSDYDMPTNGTPLSMGKSFGGTDWDEEDGDPKTPTQSTYRRAAMTLEEDIDITMNRLNKSSMPKLTIDTGYPPDATARSTLFGPFINDDSDDAQANEAGRYFDGASKPKAKDRVTHRKINEKPSAPPAKPSLYDNTKDARSGGKIAHNASPPKQIPAVREPKACPDIGTTIPPITTNVYGHLDREVPAPCEEQKKESIPLARPVMNIVLPPEPIAEIGWEIKGMTGRAKKTAFPPIPIVKGAAAKKLATANVQKANAQKPGAGMNYAAAATAKKAVNR